MLLLLGLGCGPEPAPPPPCEDIGAPGLELTPAGVDFGAFVDGGPLLYGTPPQGGAPYSPFNARASGLVDLDEGAHVRMWAVDTDDGADLGAAAYDLRFVCANVGDAAGWWVGSELHLRFEGWELDALEGRSAEVTVEVSDLSGAAVQASVEGVLTRM